MKISNNNVSNELNENNDAKIIENENGSVKYKFGVDDMYNNNANDLNMHDTTGERNEEMKINANESQVSNQNNNNNGQNDRVDTSNIQHLIDNENEFDDKKADDIEMQS